MKTRLLILFAIALIPGITESFADEIKVKIGETISYENLKFYFYDIEDSRCPSDVTCIWEGKVSAMIRVSNDTLDIGGPQPIGFVQNSFPPYSILLKDIQPYPVSTEKPDYVAILQITKSDSRPDDLTDEQICGEGFVLTNGICMRKDTYRGGDSFSTGQKLQTGPSLGNDPNPFGWFAVGISLFIVSAYVIMKIKKRKNEN